MHRINGLDLIERKEQLKSSKPIKKSWNFVYKTFLISQLNLKIYEDADKYKGTVFRPGQYKVFLNEIDEQAAAGAQNKNDYVNITEIILNISDDINGIYSYFLEKNTLTDF